jgi:hypothetical protein
VHAHQDSHTRSHAHAGLVGYLNAARTICCKYIYIYISIYLYIYIYIYIYIYAHTRKQMHPTYLASSLNTTKSTTPAKAAPFMYDTIQLKMYIHVCVYIYIYIYTCIYTHTYIHTIMLHHSIHAVIHNSHKSGVNAVYV